MYIKTMLISLMAGLYLHIPFCKSRCIYCAFFSSKRLSLREKYVDALLKEMDLRKDYIKEPFSTVYLGGGTPSVLTAEELEKIFQYIYKVYPIDKDAEITIECNPDDVTPDFADFLRLLPVNRVSMGAQTFSDERLKFLHRRHNSHDVSRAIALLRKAEIRNISIDLMFGFPNETLAEWEKDISEALKLGVEHISAYSLTYEEDTVLGRMLAKNEVQEISDELSNAMYDELTNRLTSVGYEHYEISNFAKKGFRSRHNSSYWKQVPYIGIGAAAHSYNLFSRQWNVSDLDEYIKKIDIGIVPMELEVLDENTRVNDLITTALRTCNGIDLNMVETVFGKKNKNHLITCSKGYVEKGLMVISDNHLRLTKQGIYISNAIMSDLMIV